MFGTEKKGGGGAVTKEEELGEIRCVNGVTFICGESGAARRDIHQLEDRCVNGVTYIYLLVLSHKKGWGLIYFRVRTE